MANKVAEKHYIADEKLGGVEREYVESDKQAEAGDYVVMRSDDPSSYISSYKAGDVFKVDGLGPNLI